MRLQRVTDSGVGSPARPAPPDPGDVDNGVMRGWMVYILECSDGTLYTGITVDLDRRLAAHARGTASKYTRARLPVRVVYQEAHVSRSSALRREASIKSLSRDEKRDQLGLR